MFSKLSKILTYPLLLLIRVYQLLISPLLGNCCRFTPTCSHYAYEALKQHGIFKGLYLTVIRIAKCRPGSQHFGYDPVPQSPAKSFHEKH